MITRTVKIQLVAFVVITVLGITYTGIRYVGLDRFFGGGGYRVSMALAESGGIFENAEVTYRGYAIGRVGTLSLTPEGVDVELVIGDQSPPIPADLDAVVANRSAVGEQYVDLRPRTNSEPYLEPGDRIPQDRTSTPIPTQDLLNSVDGLARSVPLDSLRTVVNELGTAFAGKGTDLQVLLDQGSALTTAAVDAQPQTLALLRDLQTVLDTQRAQGSNIAGFSTDLDLVAEQLATSDPDLRRLLVTGQEFGAQVDALLQQSAGDLSTTIANLGTVTNVLAPRQTQVRSLFQLLPALSAAGFTVAPGDGTAHFGLVLNINDPFPCLQGYEGTYAELQAAKAADPDFSDVTDEPGGFNTNVSCTEPVGSTIDVRGAARAPTPSGSPDFAAVAVPGAGFQQGGPAQDSQLLLGQLSSLLNRLLFGG